MWPPRPLQETIGCRARDQQVENTPAREAACFIDRHAHCVGAGRDWRNPAGEIAGKKRSLGMARHCTFAPTHIGPENEHGLRTSRCREREQPDKRSVSLLPGRQNLTKVSRLPHC